MKAPSPEDDKTARNQVAVTDHPEVLMARISGRLSPGQFEASARCTPAGLLSMGIMVSSVLLSVSAIILAAGYVRRGLSGTAS